MELAEPPAFDHKDRKDIYEHVERSGTVAPGDVRAELNMDRRAFGHHLAILKRDGAIEEADGELRIGYGESVTEEFSDDGIDVVIRQARQDDLTGLIGAIRETIGGGSYVDAETVADVVEAEGVLLRHNELESRIFFVATVEDEVVGWVHLKHPEIEKLSHTAELTLGVLETYQDHGIGSHLLERGLEWAASKGYEKIYNSLPATNDRAMSFLARQGWETEAVREDHYKIDGENVDQVMMARKL